MKEIHELPCLKRKLVHSALSCICSVDKKQIRQTQRMELFIVTYQGGGSVGKKSATWIATIGKE